MKILKRIPEVAMVATFLKGEISSARFSDDLRNAMRLFGVDEAVIRHPDVTDKQQNELRARVLGEYRGYGQGREMFEDVPDNLTWFEAELTRNEIGFLRYVEYSYWDELSDNTHLVKVGGANIRKGKIVFNVSHDRFLTVAEEVRRGRHDFEPMILWGRDVDSPLNILEGHLRATAFELAGDEAPMSVNVLVGLVNSPVSS